MRTAIKTKSYTAASKQPAPQVVDNPRKRQHFTINGHASPCGGFLFQDVVTLTTHGRSGCGVPLKWDGRDYATTPSGQRGQDGSSTPGNQTDSSLPFVPFV